MDEPRPVEEIRELSRQPIYRVRGSLRELQEVGYVRPEDDRWMITEEGRDALARA
jgi:DNA-binding IclR family transcriptional regulator